MLNKPCCGVNVQRPAGERNVLSFTNDCVRLLNAFSKTEF